MYDCFSPLRTYRTPKILRSSPRRHLGERTTTIPMNTPPSPKLTVSGCYHYMEEGLVRVTDPPLFSPSPPLWDLEIGKERMTKSSSAPFLSALPIWNRFGLFIQADIALMPSWFNLSLFQSRQNGAALLLHMSAVLKPASSQVGRKVWKGILQLLFAGQLHAVHIEGREPRRIRCQGATRQAVQLHMSGGMPAPAQLLAHIPGGKGNSRVQRVQYA